MPNGLGYFDRSIFGAIDDDTNTGGTGVPQRATIDLGNQVEHCAASAETHNARQSSPSQGFEFVRPHGLPVTWTIASVFHTNITDIRD